MPRERRTAPRTPAQVYFNKYIDGQPYLCETVSVSETGMLLRRIAEPDAPRAGKRRRAAPAGEEPRATRPRRRPKATRPSYAIEMAKGPLDPGDERIWLCATSVWQSGDLEAIEFVVQSDRDRTLLRDLLAQVAA